MRAFLGGGRTFLDDICLCISRGNVDDVALFLRFFFGFQRV